MILGKVIKIISITLLILSIPFIGMQFSSEIHWNLFDFVIAGFLIFGLFSTIYFIIYYLKTSKYKYWVLGLAVLFFLLVWIELAVGIFNSSFSGS